MNVPILNVKNNSLMKQFFTLLNRCFLFSVLSLAVVSGVAGSNHEASSSLLSPDSLVINEINYNASLDFDPGDWVELYNPMDHPVNVSGWVFKDEDDLHAFTFASGTEISSGGYIVIANDMTAFHNLFPSVTNYVGSMGFGLAGGGELIRLYNNTGTLIDTVNYDDVAPWPTRPDGQGATLELLSPDIDNALGQNWKASGINTHGTPGAANSINVGFEEFVAAEKLTLTIYPNPIQTTATIKINTNQAPDGGTLEIYNLAGQKVQQIDNITSNLVDFNRNGMQSGCYFVRYTNPAGNLSGVGKMMVE
jgi:hypothetical protein